MVNRVDILKKGIEITTGDRMKDYGTPRMNHQRIADLWNVYLEEPSLLQPHDVAIMMALVKIARLLNSPDHLDSYIDAATYMAIAGEISTSEAS